jgi:hypothetical protein
LPRPDASPSIGEEIKNSETEMGEHLVGGVLGSEEGKPVGENIPASGERFLELAGRGEVSGGNAVSDLSTF